MRFPGICCFGWMECVPLERSDPLDPGIRPSAKI
jgi:hypothetical protein